MLPTLKSKVRRMPSHYLLSTLLSPTLSFSAFAAPIASPSTLRQPSPTPSRLPLWVLRRSASVSPRALPLPASYRGLSSEGGMGDQAVSYLSQKDAAEIDEILMGPLGFSVDQLMVPLRSPLFPFFYNPVDCFHCPLLHRNWRD